MPAFSTKSKTILATCDQRLIDVMELAIKRVDFAVLCGHRSQAAQDAAIKAGTSKTPWPKSKHNSTPARAVDVLPYPFKAEYWHQPQVWADLAAVILACADELGVPMRWGGDWDRDGQYKDEKFFDGPHFELI